MTVLRPSLLPGLLDAVRHNLHHGTRDVRLFEIGRIFEPSSSSYREHYSLAMAMTGLRAPGFWMGDDREAKLDLYDLKGVVEVFLERFGLGGVSYTPNDAGSSLFFKWAVVNVGKQTLGEIGLVVPALAKQYDARDLVWLAELNLETLLALRSPGRSVKPLPQFPGIRRDVAMLLTEAISHDEILKLIKRSKAANLEGIELFDVFRGKNIPPGQKSVAYALTYRNRERTLTDAEVNTAHAAVVERLKSELHAVIRE
jgi:phenylalanyl-tRNA synthetase beta chain